MTNVEDMTLGDEVVVQANDLEVRGRVVKLELRGAIEYIATLEDAEAGKCWRLVLETEAHRRYISEVHKPNRIQVLDVSVIDDS